MAKKNKLKKKLKGIDINEFCLDDVFKIIKKASKKKEDNDDDVLQHEVESIIEERISNYENNKETNSGKYVININVPA